MSTGLFFKCLEPAFAPVTGSVARSQCGRSRLPVIIGAPAGDARAAHQRIPPRLVTTVSTFVSQPDAPWLSVTVTRIV